MGNVKIIAASAGSGKTYRLAYEYVKSVVREPTLYRRILAVTFTNKATGEMSSRILERLHELATPGAQSPYLEDLLRELPGFDEARIRVRAAEAQRLILHDYSRFAVLTIDRFFQRLIRSFMRELGIDAGFNLELETDSLLELAADALIDRAAGDGRVRDRLFAAARDRIEEGKSRDLRRSLAALGSELFREEYRRHSGDISVDDAGRVSSLIDETAERAARAHDDMKSRAREALAVIDAAGVSVDDFKGRSARGLGVWLGKVAAGAFIPLSAAAREAAESDDPAAWAVKTSPSRGVVAGLIPTLRPMLADLDTIYNENSRLVAGARLLRENQHNFLLLADLQAAVEQICRDENIVPISETNRMIASLVTGNDTPFIFEKAGSYFSRFFIDEFQDTSRLQWDNFVPLLRDAVAGEEGTPVMLIGDVKQAIYRWRGGDWQILSRRVRDEPGFAGVEFESLDTNHRSLRRVVEFNNMAIERMVEAGNASLDAMVAKAYAEGDLSSDEQAELTGMLAEAYRGHTQKPRSEADEGYVTLTVYDADGEGRYVPPLVERIEQLQSRGYRAGDIAVLVRSNTQGARVARMLLEHKRLNPSSPYNYDVVTAEALTVGASAVSGFVIACLKLAVDRGDVIRRAVFNRWLGRDFDASLAPDDADFFARIAALSPEEAFEEIVVRFGLNERAADVAYIQAIHEQITTFSSRSVADIPLFLKWWDEHGAKASIAMQEESGAITVSTIHKSKGLQYKAVIVPYLSWLPTPDVRGRSLVVWAEASDEGLTGAGALPVNYKEAMAGSFFSARYYREQVLAYIDAVNMFYVAATRAEQELHLMVSSNPRDGRGNVGNILRTVLGVTEDFTEWGAPVVLARAEDSDISAQDTPLQGPLSNYPTWRPGAKVRLRLPATRYTGDDGAAPDLAPRDMGVLMHRAFENAATADDVRRELAKMELDALISPGEHANLKAIIERAFAAGPVAEWFSPEWQLVRTEGDIVLPRAARAASDPATRRPDRVMVSGDRAVVVDYKFGRSASVAHAAQMRDYMSLLAGMGHTNLEGYIWYVSADKIEKVI